MDILAKQTLRINQVELQIPQSKAEKMLISKCAKQVCVGRRKRGKGENEGLCKRPHD